MRGLFTLVAALSFALCVAAAAFWAWSYTAWAYDDATGWRAKWKFYPTTHYRCEATTRRGSVKVHGLEGVRMPDGGFRGIGGKLFNSSHARMTTMTAGFGFGRSPPGDTQYAFMFMLMFPFWAVVLLTAVLPALWVILWRRRRAVRRRAQAGLCGKCGYDLTGNTTGVCPECGTAVATGTTRAGVSQPAGV